MSTQNPTILILSPSFSWQDVLLQWQGQKLNVHTVPDYSQLAAQAMPDFILVDVSLDVLDVTINALQDAFPSVRGIVLTALPPDKSVPDRYTLLTKPVRATVLLERIATGLLLQEAPLALGGLYFFPRGKFLAYNTNPTATDIRLKLTEKEADIIAFLNGKNGEMVNKETLLLSVWGYGEGIDTHTLETHIYRLRQKIAETFNGVEVIATGEAGYRLHNLSD